MRIICPSCQANYDIKAEALGGSGRMVKCADCGHKWFQQPAEHQAAELLAGLTIAEEAPADAADGDDEAMKEEVTAGDAIAPPPEEIPPPSAPAGPRLIKQNRKPSAKKPLATTLPAAGLAALVMAAILAVVLRVHIVQLQPNLAGLYAAIGLKVNKRGLNFEQITPRVEIVDGRATLFISGQISNLTSDELLLPELRVAILDTKDKEIAILTSKLPASLIAPNQTLPFSVKLAMPSDSGETLVMRFASEAEQKGVLQR